MYKNFIRLALSLIFCVSTVVFAQTADCPPQIYHLKNGQTVVIKEIHTNPIVTVDTWVKTGSLNENDKNNGVSHFLEHLMFKGTEKYKTGEIDRILESGGGKFNAATSKDFTHFYITMPVNEVETAIKLHADMMINADVPEVELNKERGVVVEEIRRSEDSPDSTLFDNLISMIFKTHPYRYKTLGPQKNIENISRKDILAYYHRYYVPSNMITVVVGDVNPQKILCLLENNFNGKNSTKVILPKYPREAVSLKPQEVVKKGKYGFGYLYEGFKGVPVYDKKESYALDLASSVLGGGNSSRLYQDLKEKQNIVSSIGAGHYSLRDDSVFFISADFDPSNYAKVKSSIAEELKKLAETKVTPEELNRAKTQEERAFVYDNESVEEIADSIGYSMTIEGSLDSYNNHLKYVNAVTADDIQKAVQKYIKPSDMALSVLLPEDNKNLKKAAEENSSSVKPVSDIKVNSVCQNPETYKNTVKSVLNNGMTLITNKNTSNDIVSLSVFVKGGKLLDNPPGITNLLVKTLMQGTKSKTAFQITTEVEDMGIVISPILDSDTVEIQLKSTKADFDKAFCILTDIINNPAFTDEYIAKGKNDILQEITMSRDRPLSKAAEGFTRAIYPDHPYGHTGEVLEKSIPSLTREQLLDFHKKWFIPQNMVAAVSGNIDNELIAQKFTDAFPCVPGEKPILKIPDTIKKFPANKIICKNSDTAAANMLLGWPVDGITNSKDYLTLQVINSILGGGMSSRLHITFREKQGLSYSVGSTYPSRLSGSYFAMFIGTEPKNIELVRTKFLQEAEKLKTQLVGKEELNSAKQKLIGDFLLAQETNQDKAHYLGFFETIDKGYKFTYDFPDLINSVTSEDVKAAANKYFNSPYVLSVVAPEQSMKSLCKEK